VPTFFLDIADGDHVITDEDGVEFATAEVAISEVVTGARELVAHGIMRNEDVSAQVYIIRDEDGATIATVPFRETLPGRLRG
jgi:hypothetical protein